MGSGFGYSTAWFAKAVRTTVGASFTTSCGTSIFPARHGRILRRRNWTRRSSTSSVKQSKLLQQPHDTFDLIFNDIDKAGYRASIPVAKAHLRRGGLFLVDNMLWQGRVLDPENRDPSTKGVRELTRMLHSDPDFACSIVPIRDGILVALKLR